MSILEAAVYDRKIAHSPAAKIKLPKINKTVTDSVVALDDVHELPTPRRRG